MSEPEPQENQTIQQMRAAIDAKNAEIEAAKQETQQVRTALEAEKADLEAKLEQLKNVVPPEASELEGYKSVVKDLYDRELASAPEEARANLEKASSVGSLPERLASLIAAKQLIGANIVTMNPTSPTQIVGEVKPQPQQQQPPADRPFVVPSWSDIFKPETA